MHGRRRRARRSPTGPSSSASSPPSRERFAGSDATRPPHWGGWLLAPEVFEFWQGRPSRLHDRLRYRLVDGAWQIARLAP